MGSCLSKSGKKAKEEEDDDRMPYSPSDASKKGKYDVAETTAAHIPVQSNPRTDPPDTSPPPPPVGLPETSPTRVSQESNTAGAYASYPIKASYNDIFLSNIFILDNNDSYSCFIATDSLVAINKLPVKQYLAFYCEINVINNVAVSFIMKK